MKIIINSSEADRLAVAAVLLKNRYTVRIGSETPQGKRKAVYFVEFTEATKAGADDQSNGAA